MKTILKSFACAVALAAISAPAYAENILDLKGARWSFDYDGGECTDGEIPYVADIGSEALIYLQHDNRYVASGLFYIQGLKRHQGYNVFDMVDDYGHKFKFMVTEDGYMTTSTGYTNANIRQEGNVDVVKMARCK